MGIQLRYSLLLLLALSSCIDVIVEKEDPQDHRDEIVRILDDRFPLMKAAKEGKLSELKRLLKIELFRKNVDQQDEDGNTAFLFAAEQGYEDIMYLLLQAGADPNLSDFKQRTPLMSAAYRGKINVVRRLLQIDSVKENINNQDINGDTAFIFAAKKGYVDILDLLLQAGADPNLSNFSERTPLMSAAYKGKINVIERLLQISTVRDNINATDKDGDTALSLAKKKGYKQIASLLLKAGAIPQPVKDTFLNIKEVFRKIFFLEKIREEDQPRKTASKLGKEENWLQSFFKKITSFFKSLF